MKFLILLFISITAHAQHQYKIDWQEPFADQVIEEKTKEKLDKSLLKFLKHPSKKKIVEWRERENVVTEFFSETPIICETVKDMEGEESERCAYAEKFTVHYEDITQEIAGKEAAKLQKKQRKEGLKQKAKDKKLSKDEIAEILEMLLEDR